MTTSIQKLFLAIMILVAVVSVSSCKKDKFDEPPGNTVDPGLDTISIGRLKAYYTGGSPVSIPDDVNIAGIVIADDKTGNFYKSIVIDDGDQGIAISIDVSSGLYTDYPVGRKIYVKCKGLALGTYGGTMQLGGYVDGVSVGRIAQSLLPKIIVKGPTGNDITPLIQHVTINMLNDTYLSRLIQLDNVEFQGGSADNNYAEVNKPIPDDGDRILTGCASAVPITLRTSPFSSFAFVKTPIGNGTIIGVYSKYNSTKQLSIRDTSDVNMRGIKCDGSDPNAKLIYNENFESYARYSTTIGSWTNYLEAGSKLYKIDSFSSNKYAAVSAFSSGEASNIMWLVSPSVNLDASTDEKLSFATEVGFYRAGTLLEVYISTNFTGNPTTATWTLLNPRIATQSDIISGNYSPFISSGPVDISSYSGNVFIGFKYTGSATNNQTSTFEIDNVKVTGL